ncbi:hypothetical protein CMUS01_08502 [Colletotrichum musicola]|uniref:2EXR domain-containing protein n=1 Tax=Colletotrichum musicola TaxID=2175873 RepID=A0A8H6KBL2_9PEZI|nr:hypothetical protein CMUS01_08502 [Colletotrichum musicola]
MERLINLTAETASLMVEVAKASLPQGMGASELSIMKGLTESQKALAGAMELQTRVLDSQSDTLSDHKSHPAGTFYEFGRLPAEIRKIIWEMALPGSRIFVPYVDYHNQTCLVQYYKPPSIRGVCKESWNVTKQNGGFEFGDDRTYTYGVWINYSKDIVVWLNQLLTGWHLPKVQNIAIEWRHFSEESECIKTLKWAIGIMSDCKKVMVLSRPQICRDPEDFRGHIAQLFSLDDNDIIWSTYVTIPDFWLSVSHGRSVTWKDMKEELDLLYRKKSTLQELNVCEENLPVLEAKELLLSKK